MASRTIWVKKYVKIMIFDSTSYFNKPHSEKSNKTDDGELVERTSSIQKLSFKLFELFQLYRWTQTYLNLTVTDAYIRHILGTFVQGPRYSHYLRPEYLNIRLWEFSNPKTGWNIVAPYVRIRIFFIRSWFWKWERESQRYRSWKFATTSPLIEIAKSDIGGHWRHDW